MVLEEIGDWKETWEEEIWKRDYESLPNFMIDCLWEYFEEGGTAEKFNNEYPFPRYDSNHAVNELVNKEFKEFKEFKISKTDTEEHKSIKEYMTELAIHQSCYKNYLKTKENLNKCKDNESESYKDILKEQYEEAKSKLITTLGKIILGEIENDK